MYTFTLNDYFGHTLHDKKTASLGDNKNKYFGRRLHCLLIYEVGLYSASKEVKKRNL